MDFCEDNMDHICVFCCKEFKSIKRCNNHEIICKDTPKKKLSDFDNFENNNFIDCTVRYGKYLYIWFEKIVDGKIVIITDPYNLKNSLNYKECNRLFTILFKKSLPEFR